jgi:hypothetical protein
MESSSFSPAADAHRKRAAWVLAIVAALFVIVPFLFWRGTWFGRALTDEEITQYLSERDKPRHIQHALAQIGERIGRGDATAKRWYPEVIRLAGSPSPELRITLAWVMGADNRSEEFHQALLELLRDPEPLVGRNAALALARFGDPSGRAEFHEMLHSFTVRAPSKGTLRYRLREGNSVDRGTLLARLETGGPEPMEIRSPVPGTFESKRATEGAQVAAGREILTLSPDSDNVWEALRALYLVGQPEDLFDVEPFAKGAIDDMPAQVQQQAALTAAEIRRRASDKE